MSLSTFFKAMVVVNFIVIVKGVLMVFDENQLATYVLIAGVVIAISLVMLALYEILTSANVETSIKIAWVLGFIVANTIATIVYYFYYRDKYIVKA